MARFSDDRMTVDGQQVSFRVWMLLRDAARGAEIDVPKVLQGSWSDGSLSAGTHGGAGAVDLSVAGLTMKQRDRLIWHLRRRNACAWERSRRFGWTSGDHVHAIVRDEKGLAVTAAAQVVAYDKGENGLANHGRDPHKRPAQYPIEEWMMMAWDVGKSRMIKNGTAVRVKANEYVTLATLDLPKGGRFLCELQVRAPKRMDAPGEACLSRLGWGAVGPGKRDDTGHNVILPESEVERWRTPIAHQIAGGGPLQYRVWLPGKPGETFLVKFVAKALRLA